MSANKNIVLHKNFLSLLCEASNYKSFVLIFLVTYVVLKFVDVSIKKGKFHDYTTCVIPRLRFRGSR